MVHTFTDENLMATSSIEQHKDMVLIANSSSRQVSIYHAATFEFLGTFEANSTPTKVLASFNDQVWSLGLENIRVWQATNMEDIS